ncbi:MAG: cytochrome C [Geobacter sp.]|nr:MAG: cytochrome C [Geobacter sp.]
MSKISKRILATLALWLLAAALTACGSGNKEGGSSAGDVAKVAESLCVGCHSGGGGPVNESLSGDPIVVNYQASVHALNFVGCQDCHGGGAMHNGVGPLPYPKPNHEQCKSCHDSDGLVTAYTESKHYNVQIEEAEVCNRCHTHQGAVVAAIFGYTGDGDELEGSLLGLAPGDLPVTGDNAAQPIKCNTCHVTHKPQELRVDATWNPATVVGTPAPAYTNGQYMQYRLCTQCHTYINRDGIIAGSGTTTDLGLETVLVGHHDTSWYRAIATTHYDNPTTTTAIEGYAVRTTGANPCFDCHNHEAKTNTRTAGTTPADTTIYSDWAQSGHAGKLLTVKYAAATANPVTGSRGSVENTTTGHIQVNAVMDAGVTSDTGDGWVHYNWDSTLKADLTNDRGSCQACHSSTGISNYLTQQTTDLTGYNLNGLNNNFSHLSGWNQVGGSPQNELLYCWGCHSNAGTGSLRNTSQAILTFTDPNENPIIITGAGNSTACIVCHGGRGSAGEEIESRSTRFNGHHAPTAGFLYSEQTHIGFEYPGRNYANPIFFAHDEIGLNASGPCASCHMGPAASDGKPSHSFAAVTESGGVITAITNQALCNTCHTPGGSREITPTILDEEKSGYAQASTILNNYVSNLTGYTNYLDVNLNANSAVINPDTGDPFKNAEIPTIVEDNAYRAYQNGKINADEPCAYVHNRFYIKRLIFDSIEWMMEPVPLVGAKVLDGTLTLPLQARIDFPEAVLWLGADPITGVATRP